MALTGTNSNKYAQMGALGAGIGGLLFGGGNDYGQAYDTSMDKYMTYMDQASQQLGQHEAQGRSDIQNYLAQSQEYTQPYQQAGVSGLQAYLGSVGLGGQAGRQSALSAFQTSPGYQFALNQGLQGVQRGLSASGMQGSGAEQKALNDYAQGVANQEYNQFQNRLMGLAGMGQTSAENAAGRTYSAGTNMANLGYGYGSQYSQLSQSIAQAQAEAEIAKAQAEAEAKAAKGSGFGGLIGGIAGLM
jgi:hypothetical protein